MSEADRLKEDFRRMMSGLPPMGAPQEATQREEEDQDEDLDDAKSEIRSQLRDEVQKIIDAILTKEALIRMAEEKGYTNRIGQAGVREVVSDIRSALASGFEEFLDNM
jgi:hypothetical protein